MVGMDFYTLLTSRRSVRSYCPDSLPRDVLDRILAMARLAPSAHNLQPWRILVLQSREWLDRVHAAYPRSWFMEAPHVVVVTGRVDDAWTRDADGYSSIETDLAIVLDHLTLAAWNEGVGSCWIANFEPDVLRKNLGLGPEDRVYAMTPLGWPAGDTAPAPAEKARKAVEQIVVEL